jgi:AcrR family transcriptional regulator
MSGELQLEDVLRMLEESGVGRDTGDGKARTRERILRSATELFQQQGYRRTSIDDVAQAAGVAKGTVYVHFKNKAELLFHAIAEEKKQFIGRVLPLLSADLPPAERLRGYIEVALQILPEARLISKLLSGDRELLVFLEEMGPELREQMQQAQLAGITALLRGVGVIDQLSAEERMERGRALVGVLWSAAEMMDERVRGGLSAARFAQLIARMLVHGIGAP